MANPVARMIGWLFKQGMAAVALDEKFKAIDNRFNALEDRFMSELEKVRAELILHVERTRSDLRKEISDSGATLGKEIALLGGRFDEAVKLHERIAAIEALMGRKSA